MSEHNYTNNNRASYGENGQFICPRCFHMSSSRPQIFNGDNCGCVEAAMFGNAGDGGGGGGGGNGGGGGGGQPPERSLAEHQRYAVGTSPGYQYHYSPTSYPSSSGSVPCPEGPENAEPNINLTDNTANYLSLSPEDGLNEVEHRRSVYFNENMSYQLRRFILEEEYHDIPHSAPPSPPGGRGGNGFLPQDPFIQSQTSMMVAESSKKSKQSKKSWKSSRSGDMGHIGYGADPTFMVGSWDADEGQGYYDGEGYPMTMSGMLE